MQQNVTSVGGLKTHQLPLWLLALRVFGRCAKCMKVEGKKKGALKSKVHSWTCAVWYSGGGTAMCRECYFGSPLCVAGHYMVSMAAEPKGLRIHFQGAKKNQATYFLDNCTLFCRMVHILALSCSWWSYCLFASQWADNHTGQNTEINVNSLSKFSLCCATANSEELSPGCQVKVVIYENRRRGRSERRGGGGLATGSNLLAAKVTRGDPQPPLDSGRNAAE